MHNVEDYRLRTLDIQDLSLVLEWRNSAKIRAFMYTDQLISMEEHIDWFMKLQKNDNVIYKVFEYLGAPSGIINFSDYDNRNERWNWGFYLGRDDLPPGAGTVMGQLGLQFAFEQMDVRKLCGQCFSYNIASIKFHQKMGFKEEGLLKKHVLKNGLYEDICLFALFKEDYVRRNCVNEIY